MKGKIKQLLREGLRAISESPVSDVSFNKAALFVYKSIVKNINTIKLTPTDANDWVMDSRGNTHLLKGVKFNIKQIGWQTNAEVLLVNTIGKHQNPFYDGSKNKFVFFIISQVEDSNDFENNAHLARLRFPSWVSEEIFVHEFTHFLDAQRYKQTYQSQNPKNDMDYYNSPEELNAFYSEIINGVNKKKTLFKLPFEAFILKALKLGEPDFIKNLTPDNLIKLKKRLYKYYTHKNKPIEEGIFNLQSSDHKYRIEDFIKFAQEYLDIKEGSVQLVFDRQLITTTAAYGDKKIYVYAKDRALVDIMRSAAHELVHLKQDLEGRLVDREKDGADGSNIENEANAVAGILIRLYGRANPEIYE